MRDFRWVWQFARPYKWGFVIGMLLMLMEVAAMAGGTGVQKWIIDDVLLSGQSGKLVFYLVLLGIALIASPLLFTAVAMVHHHIGYRMRVTLAEYFMRYLYRAPIQEIHKERTSRYYELLNVDIYRIGEDISYQIPKGIQQVIYALVLIVLIGIASPVVLVVALVFSAAYIGLGRYFGDRVKESAKETRERKSQLTVHIEEGISASREVVAFHREEWEREKYDTLFKKLYRQVISEGRLHNKKLLISDPLRWIPNFMVVLIGGSQVMSGGLSIGTFVVLYQFVDQLVSSLQNVFNYYMIFSAAKAKMERVRDVTDGAVIADGEYELKESIQSLQLEHVKFAYGPNLPLVLKDISVDLPIGSKLAFVGLSGGGKSTIAGLLTRFREPDSGTIRVNGISLNELNRKHWTDKCVITFQEPYLFPDTIKNNILFGRDVSEEQVQEMCRKMFIHDFIISLPLGYDTEVGERGVTLSGGQRQRIALARAMLCDPEILILDEATSSLDLDTERQIQRSIDELRIGRTTIIIAHRLSTIRNADMIYVMDNGCIAEYGTHDQLITKGGIYLSLVYQDDLQPA